MESLIMEMLIQWLENIIYIIEGYSIWGWNIVTHKTRKKAVIRLNICEQCEYNKHGLCKLCGCIIKAKVRADFPIDKDGKSIDGCPLKKW